MSFNINKATSQSTLNQLKQEYNNFGDNFQLKNYMKYGTLLQKLITNL